MGIAAVRKQILEAIRSDPGAVPGRAGETPLSRIAGEFKTLKGVDVLVAAGVCEFIIENPPDDLIGTSEVNFWRGISFLTQYLPPENRRRLIEQYRVHLLGLDHLEGESRVCALMGYITSGGTLTGRELTDNLREIRSSAPILWIDAAVSSRLFAFAKRQLKRLFRERAVSETVALNLCVMLHSWRKKWPGRAGFDKMVKEFPRLTQDEAVRAKVAKWVELYIS